MQTDSKKSIFKKRLIQGENVFAGIFLLGLGFMPLVEIVLRLLFKAGVPGFENLLKHVLLWVAFLSGMIASREGEHLSLASGWKKLNPVFLKVIRSVTVSLGAAVCLMFAFSSLSFLLLAFEQFWTKITLIIMPIGFLVLSIRMITRTDGTISRKILFPISLILGLFFSLSPILNIMYTVLPSVPLFMDSLVTLFYNIFSVIKWPLIIVFISGSIFGAPIFVLLGGTAFVLFSGDWGALEALPNEAYNLLLDSSIPAIPLFTFTGFLLSQSKAGERFVKLFEHLLGWLPGGLAITAVVVCAFFTTFTGASGVTILALGGLLSFILLKSGGYSERFTDGLITSSGSIGLLFPPSLPLIMYGVVAQLNIKHLFAGGLIPGFILVLALSLTGVFVFIRRKLKKNDDKFVFDVKAILISVKDSLGEILLPILILTVYFTGLTTLVETASIAVVYTIILEVFIKKDIKLKDLYRVLLKSLPIIGGVLIILAMAKGLSNYIVDAEVPMALTDFFQNHIQSRIVFLIVLNVVLLITGCLMDIYSAILVVAPLVIPIGAIYGIHPVQLGIIFLANLELGYLTPPVGLNLFLASYTFEKPLIKIYKSVWPFFLILLAMILLITFVPWLSTALVQFF